VAFGDEAISAVIQTGVSHLAGVVTSDDDDVNCWKKFVDKLGGLAAVDSRQIKLQKRQVRMQLPHQAKGGETMGSFPDKLHLRQANQELSERVEERSVRNRD